MATPVDPTNPTLFFARDIAVGWVILNYRTSSPVATVNTSVAGQIYVTFDDGSTDVWGTADEDRVYATPV